MNDFLTELYKLLSQYDASVLFETEYSVGMEVSSQRPSIGIGSESVVIADNSWGFDADDLKAYLDASVMQSQTLGENLDESHE